MPRGLNCPAHTPSATCPPRLLHDVLHAARQARDHKAARCLIREIRRRLLACDNPPLPSRASRAR